MAEINSHCSYCGAVFPEDAGWPRRCAACGSTSFRNPLPVVVVLQPVLNGTARGILVVRRAIQPRLGQFALPGGFINYGETWQEAGARELFEESGLRINPAELRELRVRSAPDGTLIIFSMAQPRPAAELPPFAPNEEASERRILWEPAPLAFQLHEEMVREFFTQQFSSGGG